MTAAKNAIVGWLLIFRIRMFVKSTVIRSEQFISWTQSIEVEFDLPAAYPINLNVEKGLAKFWKRRKSKTLRQKGHRNG